MRIIFYVCDYCAKKFRHRLEFREQEPKVLEPFGRREICETCFKLAEKNLEDKVFLERIRQ